MDHPFVPSIHGACDEAVALHALNEATDRGHGDTLGAGELTDGDWSCEHDHRQRGKPSSAQSRRCVMAGNPTQQVDRSRVQSVGCVGQVCL
jgi:hypothetical protein